MQIRVHTDHNIEGREAFSSFVEETVSHALGHLGDHITHVEVHLSDESAHKTGQKDKRCMIEARIEGLRPTAVTCQAPTVDKAVAGASNRLKNALRSTLGRHHAHR
jgi:hypothetical protein